MITGQQIATAIDEYLKLFPEEAKNVTNLRQLALGSPDPTSRNEFQGHVTCSGLVISSPDSVVMIEHRALKRWLLPGGHLEATDCSLRGAARREVGEEVGLDDTTLIDVVLAHPECPLDIDRHTIPANPGKNEPEHEHWDFRFTFRSEDAPILRAADEITSVREAPLSTLTQRLQARLRRILSRETTWNR